MKEAKVYFTRTITPASIMQVYEAVGFSLPGKVAVKLSTGEPGGHNFLDPQLIGDLVRKLDGTIVECNTAYVGKRYTTIDHLEAARAHGFTEIAHVDIMDQDGDMSLPVTEGKHLRENYVGKNLAHYDSILMLSHFKGHAMGGFGGALKNMSIGIASARGKAWIHSAGTIDDRTILWENIAQQNDFLEAMAEACQSVMNYRKDKIVYLNVMNRLSVDCDCDKNPAAPCMKDIGVLASLDPVALDQACLDLVYQSNDPGRDQLIERIETRNGRHTVDYAAMLGIGSKDYQLIDLDQKKS